MSAETPFSPLGKGATTTLSFNIGTILDLLSDGTYYVPDYQRDSSQWDVERKSLFIESLINNLTVPPLIVYPHDDPETGRELVQIVDGQQRLTTIREFVNDGFALSSEEVVDYADNVAAIIQGKKFTQLLLPIQIQIKRYVLNLILLPKNLDSRLRLEIFRRINEAGVPLSSHDLRLAEFGAEKRVAFLRLAGLFDPTRDGAKRMIAAATKFDVTYPWGDPHAQQAWMGWWDDTTQALGQASSQMYLYYTIARDRVNVKILVESDKTQDRLKLRYDRTTTSVLDLYCAQLQGEAKDTEAKILAPFETMEKWFTEFSTWFALIKTTKVPRVPLGSSTKVALFIAAASETWGTPSAVTDRQWEAIQVFLTQGPGGIRSVLGIDYPITKGKWPGQLRQIEMTFNICQVIRSR